jgi:hypothetical protein
MAAPGAGGSHAAAEGGEGLIYDFHDPLTHIMAHEKLKCSCYPQYGDMEREASFILGRKSYMEYHHRKTFN